MLHRLVFWICVAIAVVVFGLLICSLLKQRKDPGAKAEQFHKRTVVDLIWAVIPMLILLAMMVPAARVVMEMQSGMDPTPHSFIRHPSESWGLLAKIPAFAGMTKGRLE